LEAFESDTDHPDEWNEPPAHGNDRPAGDAGGGRRIDFSPDPCEWNAALFWTISDECLHT
jgi:hypothetical protein